MNAALGARNPDFKQGPCFRCLEVRCRSGFIKKDYNSAAGTQYVQQGTLFADVAPGLSSLVPGRQPHGCSDARLLFTRRLA